MKIKSESKLILDLIISTLKLPFTFMMFLFGQRKTEDLLEPIRLITHFFWEAKFTANMIMINISIFIGISILLIFGKINEDFITQFFVNHPSDLLNLNIVPMVGSWFMHADIGHLLGNMLFLFILGRAVEKKIGSSKTALIYFGSAIISTLINSLIHIFILNQDIGGLGASGAISGLASAAMLLEPLYLTYLVAGIPMPIFVVSWTFLLSDIMGVLIPSDSNIGHIAHLGGFFAITILFALLDKKDVQNLKKGLLFNGITLGIFLIAKMIFL